MPEAMKMDLADACLEAILREVLDGPGPGVEQGLAATVAASHPPPQDLAHIRGKYLPP